jgi:predicted O-linked N-acetylglucosamine transferase (SPINDLY family)
MSDMKSPDRRQRDGYEDALAHHRAGRLDHAEAIYRKLIQKAPEHAQALFLLGAICLASQRWEEALSFAQRAVSLEPDNAHFLCNLGEALRRLGKTEAAVTVLLRAVTLRPELAEASFNLAMAFEDLGQTEAALTCLVRAADVAPERFEIHYRLGQALVKVGELARAVPHFQVALALNPESLEVLLDLSAALRGLKRSDGAVAMAHRAVALRASSALAHCELARTLSTHERAKDLTQAISHCREAIRLDPKLTDAHFGLACALVDVGALGEGLEHFRTVVKLDPKHRIAESNIAYLSVFDPESSPAAALEAAQRWCKKHAAPFETRLLNHGNERTPSRRVRVGYVGIFQDHAQAFFLAPLFAHHDLAEFELYGYAINERQDATTERLRERFSQFRDVSALADQELAALIRSDEIDVLIDFNMHMSNTRLRAFAEKPAPVQMCWLAYPGTTGLAAMDYRISDGSMDPEGASHALYSERSLCLPDAFWCYDPLSDGPAVSAPPALQNGYITFGCLNAFWKTNPYVFGLWSQVLQAVPGSRFVLLTPGPEAERRALEAFAKHGIEAARIHCVSRRARTEYLAGHAALDIALDTLPYSGHTTTLDALWMGVPVVTLVGKTAAGRAGLSVMRCVGLPELATETESQFVARAQQLSADLPALAALRQKLRGQLRSSVAMDGARFAKSFETALRGAWQEWCATTPAAQ